MPQKKFKIKYTPAAVDDMDEIFSYIAQENLAWAEKMLSKLSSKIGGLAEFPNMGSVLSEDDFVLIQRGYRFIVVSPYLVFYRIIDDTVVIHRILHGRRDYLRNLFS
ncbi:type II toxin-antitoxin system RelE/ParE family toxin [Paenibacillus sp. P96]|uniref:Type II toxin-antitoxin system RelE/ParE family toxin n=1 Tax=Paenibacillus zeirhizosphaerae TaxID=2987519 RepID=A0ABT9FMB9_9BACL|nr:type II toxin-antitoxin system RelE/ParE family toxin [Paenibacillus sp. P96]MDP4095814.1 type II toxin-antitoxin system RelE/ParE family toxin [Paenibacillus sp. P96]